MSGLRVRHDGRRIDRVAHTGGRPLGLELLPDGRLLVCDAQRGLLRVDPAGGRIELAVRDIAGTPMVFCNNAAVAADGTVFFSDSSTRYASRTGRRTSSRTPAPACCSGSTPTARSPSCSTGWPSRTGVALAPDELFVAVAETAARTVVRHWLSGPRPAPATSSWATSRATPVTGVREHEGRVWLGSLEEPAVAVVAL